MKKWKGTPEEFVKSKGWKYVEGWKICVEELHSDHEVLFFHKFPSDFVMKESFWAHNNEDMCHKDIDQLLEMKFEEYYDTEGDLCTEPMECT